MSRPNHVVDVTPGERPRILVHALTSHEEIVEAVRAYREDKPGRTIAAMWPEDFDADVHAFETRPT
jgi:hypothetical protein